LTELFYKLKTIAVRPSIYHTLAFFLLCGKRPQQQQQQDHQNVGVRKELFFEVTMPPKLAKLW
jgi:hypothetical protein